MQLDFISVYENEKALILEKDNKQSEFWDSEYKLIKNPRNPSYSTIKRFFENLDHSGVPVYRDYWQTIAPRDDSEFFRRWLFAFMSVHTSWKANMLGYNAIKDWWKWLNKWDDLHKAIDESRVGMQNNRLKYISEFAYKFWENPAKYKKSLTETWVSYRDRLKKDTLGLGPAKTSFAIELCYPNEAKISCLDTHMFQAYGLDQVKDMRRYNEIETCWIDMCTMWNIPPYIARCIYWDKKQGYTDSRYWSQVFEK
jgi:hypothetical protein